MRRLAELSPGPPLQGVLGHTIHDVSDTVECEVGIAEHHAPDLRIARRGSGKTQLTKLFSRSVVQALAFRTWRARMIRSAIAPSLDSSAGT